MKNVKVSKYGVFIVSVLAWLAIDLITKCYAAKGSFNSMVFIKNFFYLTLQSNKGVAFGISFGYMLQLIMSIFILGLLIYFGFKHLFKEKRNLFLNQFLLGIIVGGAIGNLINRIRLGYVIDFIVLKPLPVFNIADIGITVGLIILFLLTIKTNTHH